MMSETCKTQVGQLRIKRKLQPDLLIHEQQSGTHASGEIVWHAAEKHRWNESVMKNLAIASALAICAVALRNGAVPSMESLTDAVLTAASDDSLLDEQLGKLSFVSSMFPDAVLVFGEQTAELSMPVNAGEVVHTWSSQEPYLSLQTDNVDVLSASAGEVIGVYHGNGGERLVQVMSNTGIACMYGNLEQVDVEIGDYVVDGMKIGSLKDEAELIFEVRRDGVSVDPAIFLDGV